MNKQKANAGIEWTRPYGRPGYTWNPIGGCEHDCQWEMPDGTVATCYAKTVAERVAQAAYPEGFVHHYWHPERLEEPLRVATPAGIFADSMSDLMGAWVPAEQIEAVLDVCRRASHHIFFLLTKNPRRLKEFSPFPPNVWVGVSSPPDWLRGYKLTEAQRRTMLSYSLKTLTEVEASVKWMSFEPLSSDLAPIVAQYPDALNWAVIGAASNGRNQFPPDADHLRRLLIVMDAWQVPVFYKGNLRSLPSAAAAWREEFPPERKPGQTSVAKVLPEINALESELKTLRHQYADMCDRAQTAEDKAARLEAAIRAFLKLQVGSTRDELYRAIGEEPPVRRVVDVYGEEAAAKGGAV